MLDLGIFACPSCKNPSLEEMGDFVRCQSCSARYPVSGGSVNFTEETAGLSETQKAQKKFYEADPAAYPLIDMNEFIKSVTEGARLRSKIFISHKQFDTYKKIKKLGIREGDRVLEVGCFDGRNCFLVEKLTQAHCYGIDISPNAVQRARTYAQNASLRRSEFHSALAERLPFKSGSFDKVVSFDVLEHVDDKESFLREINRVLKTGGTGLIYAISKYDAHSLHWTLRQISEGTLGRDEGGGHVYENFAHPEEIRVLCDRLRIRKVRFEAFHGFFSLFLDEYLSRRIGFKIKYFFRIARVLDTPLSLRKIGNGFYITIRK
jgi:2-polyprenyl-3-methyl-5-hydroxy-6-metoxy-1,4-benzoquinol methylase